MIRTTPHPEWVRNLLDDIKPYQLRIRDSQIFRSVNSDTLTKRSAQAAMVGFYPLIESFPTFLGLILAKVPAGNSDWNNNTRRWLIANISQESEHASWWRRLARKFGVSPVALDTTNYPPAQVDVINNYLWRICTDGSLPEAIAATNFAVEGATGEWTKRVGEGFKRFPHCEEIQLTQVDLEWINAHAHYDDKHPVEALEIVKAYANSDAEQKAASQATKRALEYYALALDACYQLAQ